MYLCVLAHTHVCVCVYVRLLEGFQVSDEGRQNNEKF